MIRSLVFSIICTLSLQALSVERECYSLKPKVGGRFNQVAVGPATKHGDAMEIEFQTLKRNMTQREGIFYVSDAAYVDGQGQPVTWGPQGPTVPPPYYFAFAIVSEDPNNEEIVLISDDYKTLVKNKKSYRLEPTNLRNCEF